MKKIFVFLLMFIFAFTLLNFIQGKKFDFMDYVKSLDSISELKKPKFPNIEYKSLGDLTSYYDRYYFNVDKLKSHNIPTCYEKNGFDCDICDGMGYVAYVVGEEHIIIGYADEVNGLTDIDFIEFSQEDYDSFSPSIQYYLMQKGIEDLNEIELFIYKFNGACEWIAQPISFIGENLAFCFDYIGYIIRVILIIGDGLLV